METPWGCELSLLFAVLLCCVGTAVSSMHMRVALYMYYCMVCTGMYVLLTVSVWHVKGQLFIGEITDPGQVYKLVTLGQCEFKYM